MFIKLGLWLESSAEFFYIYDKAKTMSNLLHYCIFRCNPKQFLNRMILHFVQNLVLSSIRVMLLSLWLIGGIFWKIIISPTCLHLTCFIRKSRQVLLKNAELWGWKFAVASSSWISILSDKRLNLASNLSH